MIKQENKNPNFHCLYGQDLQSTQNNSGDCGSKPAMTDSEYSHSHRSKSAMATNGMKAAITMLAKSSYSAKMLYDKLLKKDYDEQTTQETIDKLKERGFINDEKYAQNRIENSIKKGKSLNLIALDLSERGIDSEIINRLINKNKSQITTQEQIQNIIDKKFKNLDLSIIKNFNRAVSYLLRQGFEQEDIEKFIK
ncbi:MAG: recombination regulator RecX [Elusimicrobiota bacterium]|jgi:regulatory protein|nr:recombination regulator RecX [Elusimicrobiota bacterium]